MKKETAEKRLKIFRGVMAGKTFKAASDEFGNTPQYAEMAVKNLMQISANSAEMGPLLPAHDYKRIEEARKHSMYWLACADWLEKRYAVRA